MDANIEKADDLKQPKKNDTKEVKTGSGKFKNFLLAFFVAEHIIIILILLIPFFFMVRAYAFSDFGKLSQKVSDFKPKDKEQVMKNYIEKYNDYLVRFMDPEEEKPIFEFELTEEDINSMLSDMKLSHIDKFYFDFDDENVIYLWIKASEIPYPFMFKTVFAYDFDKQVFKIQILDWQIGPLSFPASILGFVEETLNKDAWEKIAQISGEVSANIVSMESTDGLFKISVEVTDKKALIENIFSGSSFELPEIKN